MVGNGGKIQRPLQAQAAQRQIVLPGLDAKFTAARKGISLRRAGAGILSCGIQAVTGVDVQVTPVEIV